jgi:hypothetical protein
MVQINIKVVNQLTKEVVIDNTENPLQVQDYSFETMSNNAKCFAEFFKDCSINFFGLLITCSRTKRICLGTNMLANGIQAYPLLRITKTTWFRSSAMKRKIGIEEILSATKKKLVV